MSRRQILVVALSMLAYIASQANLIRIFGSLDPGIFSLQLAFTPREFWQVIDAWGIEGVQRYQAHFAYDFFHPFIYGAMGYVWVRDTPLFKGMPEGACALFAWMLPVAGLCDLVENALHVHLLSHDSGYGGPLVPVSGTASSIKWSLATLFAVVLLSRIIRLAWRALRFGAPGSPRPPA